MHPKAKATAETEAALEKLYSRYQLSLARRQAACTQNTPEHTCTLCIHQTLSRDDAKCDKMSLQTGTSLRLWTPSL